MIVHKSSVDPSWTDVRAGLPDPGLWVECICVHVSDWNMEIVLFECMGRVNDRGTWTRKWSSVAKDLRDKLSLPVTHWRPIGVNRSENFISKRDTNKNGT